MGLDARVKSNILDADALCTAVQKQVSQGRQLEPPKTIVGRWQQQSQPCTDTEFNLNLFCFFFLLSR